MTAHPCVSKEVADYLSSHYPNWVTRSATEHATVTADLRRSADAPHFGVAHFLSQMMTDGVLATMTDDEAWVLLSSRVLESSSSHTKPEDLQGAARALYETLLQSWERMIDAWDR